MAITTLDKCKHGDVVTIRFFNTEIVTGTFIEVGAREEGSGLGAGVLEMESDGRQRWLKAGMVEAVFREPKPRKRRSVVT